jgi:peroxin-1
MITKNDTDCDGILMTGVKGVGKSSICLNLMDRLSKDLQKLVYVRIITCESLVSKSISAYSEILEDTFLAASLKAPSLIIFDNLDSLLPSENQVRKSSFISKEC